MTSHKKDAEASGHAAHGHPKDAEAASHPKHSHPTHGEGMHQATVEEAAVASGREEKTCAQCGLATTYSVPRPDSWPEPLCGNCGTKL